MPGDKKIDENKNKDRDTLYCSKTKTCMALLDKSAHMISLNNTPFLVKYTDENGAAESDNQGTHPVTRALLM